ncbi:complement C1q tumor necrosis factor-related protein 3-like [Ruditapes philippinarum]|uniref:complement C1q tumor necrosis factor-related protein 3-like n=1 Tax=Ruditapes philippinarum TaxID=129788 RepID=UPI00295B3D4A|nr:complement C1q tumor necrosis factor-related protein 3-like [Ruditapes philippinarum]
MESFLSICFTACCLVIHGVKCGETLAQNVNGKETILTSEVKVYINSIVSDYVHKQNEDIDQLKAIVFSQGIKIAELEKETLAYQNVVSKLETRLAFLEANSDNTQSENENEFYEDGSEKDVKIRDKGTDRNGKPKFLRRIRRATVESGVAFSASMTVDENNVGEKQDIVFNHVITNVGNAYNNHHGTFIAPVTGTYVFYFSLHSPGARADLVLNGSAVANLYIGNDQASQLAILNVNAGDDVSVQNLVAGKQYWGSGYSTFSGFLLYEGTTSTQIVG